MNVPGQRSPNGYVTNSHEVFSVFEEAQGMTDDDILSKAVSENWVLVTNDKDFGEMVFRERRQHRGVVFLRLDDERIANKIEVLRRLMENYSEQLSDRFVVVTEKQVRFAGS
jgi:predicted nuclease of predicted toxin-antitoxin system